MIFLALVGSILATPHVLPHEFWFKNFASFERFLKGIMNPPEKISVRPRERRDTENPNGWDPIFDGSIVSGNDFLNENNVTYQDLINKPIQFKILVQGKIRPKVKLFYVQKCTKGASNWAS